MKAAEQGLRSLKSLMDDTGRVNHALLQWLTNCVTPWVNGPAIGDMRTDSANGPQLATYARQRAARAEMAFDGGEGRLSIRSPG